MQVVIRDTSPVGVYISITILV